MKIVPGIQYAAGLMDHMNHFLPFRGWRFDLSQVGDIADVLSPLPEHLDESLRDALYRRHPCNIVRVLRNREEPGDSGPDARSHRAAEFVRLWQHEGILLRDSEESLYVVQTRFPFEGLMLNRWGVIGRISSAPVSTSVSHPPAGNPGSLVTGLTPRLLLCPDDSLELPGLLEGTVRGTALVTAQSGEEISHSIWGVSGRPAVRICQCVTALAGDLLRSLSGNPPGLVLVVSRSDDSLLVTRSGGPPEFLPATDQVFQEVLPAGSVWPPMPVGLVMDLQEL